MNHIGHKAFLDKNRHTEIIAGLQNYRIDSFIQDLESDKKPGRILPFVRGLRFSALLIYAIRDILEGAELTANWGHIIDEEGTLCSRECDIIIHKKGHIAKWNGSGGGHNIMDFRFISQDDAIVVISCKSYIRVPSEIEVDYCKDMKNYVDRVWLFAECCKPNSSNKIEKKAKEVGYENFWELYSWNRKTGDINESLEKWSDFLDKIRLLKKMYNR